MSVSINCRSELTCYLETLINGSLALEEEALPHTVCAKCDSARLIRFLFFFQKEGFCRIRGSWAFLCILFCLTSRCSLRSSGFPNESASFSHIAGSPRTSPALSQIRTTSSEFLYAFLTCSSCVLLSAELGSDTGHGKARLQPYGAKADSGLIRVFNMFSQSGYSSKIS